MEMVVHLDSDVFDIVKNGKKDVEVRVNDEKRRKLKVGDVLVFLKRPNDDEEVRGVVTKLVLFSNFSDVVGSYDMERIYLKGTSKKEYLQLMSRFYQEEEVQKWGVVAIEFQLTRKDL